MRLPRRPRISSRRQAPLRAFNPRFDHVEPRLLLTTFQGVLQGTAFIDSNGNNKLDGSDTYLAGATISLFQQGNPSAIASQTTDAHGAYEFDNLSPGTYLVKETNGNGYLASGTQAQSQLNPASGIAVDTIQATVVDPNSVFVNYSGFTSNAEFIYDNILTNPEGNTVGEMKATLGTAPGLSDLSSQFISFCGDDLHGVSFAGGEKFQVLPSPATAMFDGLDGVGAGAAGRIAYLYNHHVDSVGNPLDAGALQLAIWKTLYDTNDMTDTTSTDFSTGNFVVSSPFSPTTQVDINTMEATAAGWMNDAIGKSERVTFLDATLGGQNVPTSGRQGLLAKGSLNFANIAPAQLSGFVYVDANNNGIKETGETPLATVPIALTGTDYLGQAVTLSTATAADGSYSFTNLKPGTYTVTETTQPAGYFDGLDAKAGVVIPGSNTTDVIGTIALVNGSNVPNNNFGELAPAQLSGYVFKDADADGLFDHNEQGFGGVTVKLTGTDTSGKSVSLSLVTNADGSYLFKGLQPGTYSVAEVQPAGYTTTQNTVGTVNGSTRGHLATPTTDLIDTVLLSYGDSGITYNFGELKSTGSIARGLTATIGFWQNPNGQALIKSVNGGQSSTSLGNWLATEFPNLYGSTAGSNNNLTGMTNVQVAAYYKSLFSGNQKIECQVMCSALSVYVTTSSLGGSAGTSYGFTVSESGLAGASYNVGSNGSTFGVANNASVSVISLLQSVNSQAVNGSLFNGNTTKRNSTNTVFSDINQTGDI